jgi:hypothetical protein
MVSSPEWMTFGCDARNRSDIHSWIAPRIRLQVNDQLKEILEDHSLRLARAAVFPATWLLDRL